MRWSTWKPRGCGPAGADRVTDVAVVVVQGNSPRVGVRVAWSIPGCPIPLRIQMLTGISDDAGRHRAAVRGQVADELLAALAGRVFVAHNARFDWSFLAAEVRRARGSRPGRDAALYRAVGPAAAAAAAFAGASTA